MAQGALGRNRLWLARRLKGTLEGEGERLAAPATAKPGMEQPEGILHSSASMGLRRAFEDPLQFKGLTCSL